MEQSDGRNEARTLRGGEIVGLVKPPGDAWQIHYFEFAQRIRYDFQVGGVVLDWFEGVPHDWKDRRFDSADQAASFVQGEIDAGRVSGTKPSV